MKKYLRVLPIVLYPYLFIVGVLLDYGIGEIISENDLLKVLDTPIRFLVVAALCNILCFGIAIKNIVMAKKGQENALNFAKINMFIKLAQIPAYVFHFILGLAGTLLGVFGIAFVAIAIIIDLLTIILTGINAISVSVAAKKEKSMLGPFRVTFTVCSFLYCIDVVMAVMGYLRIKASGIISPQKQNYV